MVTKPDYKKIDRTAQQLIVEARRGSGSPPVYPSAWSIVWGAKVDRIELNEGLKPSTAIVWFPELRWHETFNLYWGDMIRIRTDEVQASKRTIVFCGFITSYLSDFSGGSEKRGSSFERNAFICSDHRWLMSTTCPIYGQIVRGPDDYTGYGTTSQTAIDNSYIFASGRRCIFNQDGRPNMDPNLLAVHNIKGIKLCDINIFADAAAGSYWTARQMICYILSPLWNRAYNNIPIPDPGDLIGIDHKDWDKVLSHIVIDGMNCIEAISLMCKNLGWSFREIYDNTGHILIQFFKIGSATGSIRSDTQPTILQQLHAPAQGDDLAAAVTNGKKILWSMSLAEDIAAVINQPYALARRAF